MTNLYAKTAEIMNRVSDLKSASAVLGWDQETYMPSGGAFARAEHIATLDTLAHESLTNDSAKRIADEVRSNFDSLEPDEKEILQVFLRDHDEAICLPDSLVRETSKAQSLGQEAWKKARSENQYNQFAPHLGHLIELKILAAECYGYKENRYDALINLFEPGMTVSQLRPVFDRLRQGTQLLIAKLNDAKHDDSILKKNYPKDKQFEFSKNIAKGIGFDFANGRLDLTTHPFCTNFAPTDVRLTTRISENDLRSCLFGVIHEAGHGIYEQGIDEKYTRTSASGGTSMGIHESQSLFWEGILACQESFWQWSFPKMQKIFPEQLAGSSPRKMFKAVNGIKPSLIRVEADGLTYNMHIILRFEIEEAFVNGKISVADIPELWREKMREYLGILPETDSEGCLQDVHWSFGGIGYFATYTLGRLYSAMLWNQVQSEFPNIQELIANGKFTPIREWLRINIHRFGRTRNSEKIINDACGRGLTEDDFLGMYARKINDVYGIS